LDIAERLGDDDAVSSIRAEMQSGGS